LRRAKSVFAEASYSALCCHSLWSTQRGGSLCLRVTFGWSKCGPYNSVLDEILAIPHAQSSLLLQLGNAGETIVGGQLLLGLFLSISIRQTGCTTNSLHLLCDCSEKALLDTPQSTFWANGWL
jgi:hypothetical protein